MSVHVLAPVWANSKQHGGHLLVLIALADIADADGVCWPGIAYLAKMCRITDRHVKRIIGDLIKAGELEIVRAGGNGAKDTNRYRVLTLKNKGDISSKGDICDKGRVTFATNKGGAHVTRSVIDPSIDPSSAAAPGEEKKIGKEPSPEAIAFAEWFQKLLVETGANVKAPTATLKTNWAETYDLLLKDGYDKTRIVAVCRWARRDEFWKGNFYSATKLRKVKDGVSYFITFDNRRQHEQTAAHRKPDSRSLGVNSNLNAFDEYDRRQKDAAVAP